MEDFTKELYNKIASKHKRSEIIDYVYNYLDNLLLKKKFNDVDNILSELIMDKLNDAIILSILTVTLPYDASLPTRYYFYNDAEKLMNQRNSVEETKAMLEGLKH